MASDGWTLDALCSSDTFKEIAWAAGAENDPSEVFFPVTSDSDGKPFSTKKGRPKSYALLEARFERIARATCAECPVRLDCLLWTMETEQEPYGIAGGLDAANRSELLSSDQPAIIKRDCKCGVTIFGVKGSIPSRCSSTCRS